MEERRCRLPNDQTVWQSFRSVRKSTTALGQVRFDAAHDEKYGHADHWWAFCLAESAVSEQPRFGLLEYFQSGAAARELARLEKGKPVTAVGKPVIADEAPVCPECKSACVIPISAGQKHCNQCGINFFPKNGTRPEVHRGPTRAEVLAKRW